VGCAILALCHGRQEGRISCPQDRQDLRGATLGVALGGYDVAGVVVGEFVARPGIGVGVTECDSSVNDVEGSDTSKRADSGCSTAAGGRGEAGHPAQNPRCALRDHLHGVVRAAHRAPTARRRH
jgi:hypothetical protein